MLYYQMFQFSIGILSSFGKTALGGGSVSLCHYLHARIVVCANLPLENKSLLDYLCAHIRGGHQKTKQILLPFFWLLGKKQKRSYLGTTQISYTNINSPYVPSWRSDPAKKLIWKKSPFFLLFDFLCLLYSVVTNQAIYIEEFSLNFPFPEDWREGRSSCQVSVDTSSF